MTKATNGEMHVNAGPSYGNGDLVLSGIGNSAGGLFRNASIDGMGTIDGDLVCETVRMNGVSRVGGNVRAGTVEVNGESAMSGDVIADRIRLNGKVRIQQNLKGDDIEIHGAVRIGGDCTAELLSIRGTATVQRSINAETIDIRMQGATRIGEIGCASLRVQPQSIGLFRQWFGAFIRVLLPRLHVHLIEGDDIELANTTADIVRGHRVTIGPGCRIGQVEYRDSCRIDSSSKIRSKTRKGGEP